MKPKYALTTDERAALDALVLADVKKPREKQRITFSPETVKAAKLNKYDAETPGSAPEITKSLTRLSRRGLIMFRSGRGWEVLAA